MIFFTLFTLTALVTAKYFDLDKSDVVLVPVGQKVECRKESEFMFKAQAWVIEDPEIIRLGVKMLKPPKDDGMIFAVPKKSAFEISCTRDCKVGEEFKVKMHKKDLLKSVVLETKEITVRVVEKSDEEL